MLSYPLKCVVLAIIIATLLHYNMPPANCYIQGSPQFYSCCMRPSYQSHQSKLDTGQTETTIQIMCVPLLSINLRSCLSEIQEIATLLYVYLARVEILLSNTYQIKINSSYTSYQKY